TPRRQRGRPARARRSFQRRGIATWRRLRGCDMGQRRGRAGAVILALTTALAAGCGKGTQYECQLTCAPTYGGGTYNEGRSSPVKVTGGDRGEAEDNCKASAPSSCASPSCSGCNVSELEHP